MEVLFLGIYYVVMVAALSVKQVEGELATITSRGASIGQLFQFQVFEALIICAAAFVFGPFLAYGFVWSLANIGPLSDISQTDWAVNLTSASWIAAGISVLACFYSTFNPSDPNITEKRCPTPSRYRPQNEKTLVAAILCGYIFIYNWFDCYVASGVSMDRSQDLMERAPIGHYSLRQLPC